MVHRVQSDMVEFNGKIIIYFLCGTMYAWYAMRAHDFNRTKKLADITVNLTTLKREQIVKSDADINDIKI